MIVGVCIQSGLLGASTHNRPGRAQPGLDGCVVEYYENEACAVAYPGLVMCQITLPITCGLVIGPKRLLSTLFS